MASSSSARDQASPNGSLVKNQHERSSIDGAPGTSSADPQRNECENAAVGLESSATIGFKKLRLYSDDEEQHSALDKRISSQALEKRSQEELARLERQVYQHDVLSFQPTEIPAWRSDGVYQQLWVVNEGEKTSDMVKLLEDQTQLPSLKLSAQEQEDEKLACMRAWKLFKKLGNGPLQVDTIIRLHSSIVASSKGLRTLPAGPVPFIFSDKVTMFLEASYVLPELTKLVSFYNERFKTCSTLLDHFKLVAYVGAAFTSIHPFSDGNGRVVRLLLSTLLHRFLGGAAAVPVYLCGRSNESSRRIVFLFALEQVNRTWTHGGHTNLDLMQSPAEFCAFLIEAATKRWNEKRLPDMLPRTVVPRTYNLSLQILDNSVQGRVIIEVEVLRATRAVQLNCCNLYIDSVTAVSSSERGNKILPINRFWEEKEVERLLVSFNETADVGKPVIAILYHAKLKRWLRESLLRDGNCFIQDLNLQPGISRMLWPCWDEPFFKASFRLKVELPKDLIVFSNMPSIQSGGAFSFEASPLLAPHLVSLAIGRLHAVVSNSNTRNGVCVRMHFQDGSNIEVAAGAQDFVSRLLDFYERFFQQPYPLQKLDFVAEPRLIKSSAKVGCIVLPEVVLFGAESEQRRTLAVHIATIWCQTLMTSAWWTSSWIEIGIAQLAAEHALQELCPEAKLEFQGHKLLFRGTRRPLQVAVMKVGDYVGRCQERMAERSLAVFRMLEYAAGTEAIKAGVRSVMLTKQLTTYSPDDLWSLLPRVGCHGVRDIVNSWVGIPSFPLLKVSYKTSSVPEIRVEQVSFSSGEPGTWIVPFSCCWGIAGEAGEERVVKLHVLAANELLQIHAPAGLVSWIKLNWGEAGCFAVLYDDACFEMICSALKSKQLPTLERLGVLWNIYFLWSARIESGQRLSRCLEACETDEDEAVFATSRGMKEEWEKT